MWSRCGVAVIGNLSGLKAVVFLWRFGPLLCDARAICGTGSPRVTSLSSLYDGNDKLRHRKNSKATNQAKTDTVCPLIAQKRRGQLYVEVSEVYFYIYSLL